MENKLLNVLDMIIKDLHRKYNDFNEIELKKIISRFQKDFLKLYIIDYQIKNELDSLSTSQLREVIKNLKLNLLQIPTQKYILVQLLNGLILQSNKKDKFLDLAKTLKLEKKSQPKKKSKITTITSSDYDEMRNKWLTESDLKELKSKLSNVNMNDIRAIVKPWNIKPKGRKKIDLIQAIIDYISRMRGLTKLGI
ncbi:MAG: hypothetical protein ACTSRP_01315 [Candidatus Helarchaeota archaeon]